MSAPSSRVAVIGAGVSALLLDLVKRGYRSLDAVDISATALDALRDRLGSDASAVQFVVADVRDVRFDGPVDVWHDRAMFHFLTDQADKERYVQRVVDSVALGGHVVMATFALDGPTHCSGLPVARYSAEGIRDVFGEKFDLVDSCAREHTTPSGAAQSFTHALLRRRPAG